MNTRGQAAARTFESLSIGEAAAREHVITKELVEQFANVSGDHNPLHTDEEYARGTQFNGRIAHGMLVGAFVSELVGMNLPGKYSLIVKESLEFKKPIPLGSTIRIDAHIAHKSIATRLIELALTVTLGGDVVAVGEVIVKVLQ